ncbi:MAG: hypothetical protein Q9M23_01125, partial [Mariprofundaceae bacterium]|nr:hypothetical protein [Mariprofundaceae bacterium]
VSDSGGLSAVPVTRTVIVVDTTPPTVTAELIPLGHDDEDESKDGEHEGKDGEHEGHSEGLFQVVFTATDIADTNPVLVATLNGVTVTNGQIVELEQSKKSKSEFEHGKLGIKGMSFTLDVTATDASGNVGTAAAFYTFPVEHEDDDKSKADEEHHGHDKSGHYKEHEDD